MMKRSQLSGFLFSLFVLGAVLLESVHGFHHLETFSSEKRCHHYYNHKKTEIGHAHHDFEDCFVCEFAFSSYTSVSYFTLNFRKPEINAQYIFSYSKEITHYFRGTLFALRAPPTVVV